MAERAIASRLTAALSMLVACSDDGAPAAEVDSGGSTGGGEAYGTGAEVTTVSSASTTGSGTTTASTAESASADGSTSGAATSPGSSGESGNGLDESTTGGPLQPGACETDRDCVLVDDCCSCVAQDVDAPAPDCAIPECPASGCGVFGLAGHGVHCNFGKCELVPASCNEALVSCESLPPQCPEGTQPETDGMGCWTYECVPVQVCDVVPSCEECTDDETCIETLVEGESWWSCEPLPAACAGVPTCGCMPGVCKHPGYETCVDTPNGLDCTCSDC